MDEFSIYLFQPDTLLAYPYHRLPYAGCLRQTYDLIPEYTNRSSVFSALEQLEADTTNVLVHGLRQRHQKNL